MKQIRNIIFDLSEVLLTGIKSTGIALRGKHNLEESLHHQVGWTNVKTPLLVPLVDELFHGNITESEYLKAVVEQYPQIGTEQWLRDHIRENFREVEGTREILIDLKRANYKLALLSVHAKEWIEYCELKFNFHELFDVCAYSYEAKSSKPDPNAYFDVLKKLKAEPYECFFIDDSELNTRAAEKLGIQSLIFTTAEQLRKDLRILLPDFS